MTSRPPILPKLLLPAFGLLVLLFVALSPAIAASAKVALVASDSGVGPARHGLDKLTQALQSRNVTTIEAASLEKADAQIVVVAGLAPGAGEAAKLARDLRLQPSPGPESLLIRKLDRDGKTVWLVTGSDPRGLMYALLDVADRVSWAKSPAEPLGEVREADEKPFSPERALSVYTMQRSYWESRLYDEAYWTR